LAITGYDLAVCLVAAPEMTRLNETCLHHQGSTDVITFNYSENQILKLEDSLKLEACSLKLPSPFHGEIFICVDETITLARRFRTTWQSELVRYLIHGILHLQGFDDLRPAARRKMKREESRLLQALAGRYDLRKLAKGSKLR
jgi:probable rRNA maturation factor